MRHGQHQNAVHKVSSAGARAWACAGARCSLPCSHISLNAQETYKLSQRRRASALKEQAGNSDIRKYVSRASDDAPAAAGLEGTGAAASGSESTAGNGSAAESATTVSDVLPTAAEAAATAAGEPAADQSQTASVQGDVFSVDI